MRVALFREKFPSLSLPPTPVITRWGTWLEATSYYAENFDSLKHFVTLLKEDARSIGECKELTQIPNLKNQLYFLHEHFGKLPKLITYFENRNLKLNDGLTTLDVAVNNLKSIPSDFGCGLRQKFEAILNRNPDLITLQQLCMETIPQNLTAKYEEIKEYFQYAPITSCDVERTFSIYKDVLNSKRTKLTEENLEKLLLVNINTPLLNLNDKMNK